MFAGSSTGAPWGEVIIITSTVMSVLLRTGSLMSDHDGVCTLVR